MTSDPNWKLDVVRLATWATELALADASFVRGAPGCAKVADQLARAVGSISANLWEGLGRTSPRDKARYVAYALESTREAISWYVMIRKHLPPRSLSRRLAVLVRVRQMLVAFLRNHHRRQSRPA
jgi:four helix bundle protein